MTFIFFFFRGSRKKTIIVVSSTIVVLGCELPILKKQANKIVSLIDIANKQNAPHACHLLLLFMLRRYASRMHIGGAKLEDGRLGGRWLVRAV